MGISYQPPNINPGVGGASIPAQNPLADAGQSFVQALLMAQQEQGRNSRSSAELDMQRQIFELKKLEMQQKLAEQKAEQLRLQQQGEALKQLLPSFVQMGGAAQLMAPAAQAPFSQPTPLPPVQQPGPMQQMSSVVQQMAPDAVPGFVKDFSGLAQDAQKRATRLASIDKAVGAIQDPGKRPGARSLLLFAELGANLPKEAQMTMFPELFEQGVDPSALNAATSMFRTGLFTWGQARRQAGLQKLPNIPDDVKFEPTRPRQDQLKAAAQLRVMVAARPILDEYSKRKSPGPITTFVKGGKAGSLRELLLNPFLAPEDRQFLQSGRQFTDAWVRVVSGAQTNEHEYGRFIAAITETFGDDEQTRQQKQNMRRVMEQAVADIAGGTVTRTQVIDQALKMDWTPEQRRFLESERKWAERYESDLKTGKVRPGEKVTVNGVTREYAPLDLSSGSPASPEDFQDQLDEIRAAIRMNP